MATRKPVAPEGPRYWPEFVARPLLLMVCAKSEHLTYVMLEGFVQPLAGLRLGLRSKKMLKLTQPTELVQ